MTAAHLSPMFRQWRELKQLHPDKLLLFRMGDFYEMFGDDAETAAAALELTLTARDGGKGAPRVPMCGIPYHALDRYLPRLKRLGLKAAIAEQVEDPKLARGLVKREVTWVITPGTVTEEALLDAGRHNYLAALADAPQAFGLAVVDVSTGTFRLTGFEGARAQALLLDELERVQPAEVLWPLSMQAGPLLRQSIEERLRATVTVVDPPDRELRPARDELLRHFGVASLEGFGIEGRPLLIEAAAAALRYVRDNQPSAVRHLLDLSVYSTGETMTLDAATRRNLELTATLREQQPGRGTLLWLLDETATNMGARLLREWLVRPLLRPEAIERRLDAVDDLHREVLRREEIRALLRPIVDLERLVAKATTARATPRELAGLRASLGLIPELKALAASCAATLLCALADELDPPAELVELLAAALVDEPPAKLGEGGVIRDGYSPELDQIRSLSRDGKEWIANLEVAEREATGIGSLKVGYNQVFGYFIEVTRANLALVPERYLRKQTLANAERYITPELKDHEAAVLSAEERLVELETALFDEVRSAVADQAAAILRLAGAVAELDALASLAQAAAERGYVRPVVDESEVIEILGGRHTIVEATQPERPFVPNDTWLDTEASTIHILTGPNMSGKSTYLRQVALIVLMAQTGSFVPAAQARIGVVDRIFSRVGAQDDLATGQSTFMVEMIETANILHNATRRSLVILDEIGRGTSTYDGLSIAWAVVEHLHDQSQLGAKTLFATHYHYLNELQERLERVRNFRVAVAEEGGTVRFLHRLEPGGTDRSYGIEVARLAGLPAWVIQRAGQILASLEETRTTGELPEPPPRSPVQLSLFAEAGPHPAVEKLRRLDVLRMTPIEAIAALHELQRMVNEE